MIKNLLLTAELVTPVFLIVALGYFLKKTGLINNNFIELTSKIVFKVSLPALIFIEISSINLEEILNIWFILYAYLVTVTSFLISWLIANRFVKDGKDKASFIQGSFRGNYAIIGLAIITNVFGSDSLAKASLLLAFIVPLYNVLSVIALTVPMRKEKNLNLSKTFLEILKNPLIIAVFIALPFSYFKLPVHSIIQTSVGYVASIALPLALVGVGGYISFENLKNYSLAILSSAIKIIIVPAIGIYFAWLFQFSKEETGILFILFASPTAIVSFIMAEAMGANSRLAGNILLLTTLGSLVTITIGLFILFESGLI